MPHTPNLKRLRHIVRGVDSLGYELLISLMLINHHNPLQVSWQPVTDLLRRLDRADRELRDAVKVEPPDTDQTAALKTASVAIGKLSKDMIALTRATQMETVPPDTYDNMAIELRRSIRPSIDRACDAMETLENQRATP